MKYKGIMFDMDNTILKSKIDFGKMKYACKQILLDNNVHKWTNLDDLKTTSQLIEVGKEYERQFGEENKIVEKMLAAATLCEIEGMKEATLEEGAFRVLQSLAKEKLLVILTNNATVAAKEALLETGVSCFFERIFGRDCLPALKPSPLGVKRILQQYPHLEPSDWAMIGDSWIDGKAAVGAGVDFIGYQIEEAELKENNIEAVLLISKLEQIL